MMIFKLKINLQLYKKLKLLEYYCANFFSNIEFYVFFFYTNTMTKKITLELIFLATYFKFIMKNALSILVPCIQRRCVLRLIILSAMLSKQMH